MLTLHCIGEAFFVQLCISAAFANIESTAIKHCHFFGFTGPHIYCCISYFVPGFIALIFSADIRHFALVCANRFFQSRFLYVVSICFETKFGNNIYTGLARVQLLLAGCTRPQLHIFIRIIKAEI